MSARELFGVLLVALGFPLRACSKTPIMERDTASQRKRPLMESCRPAIIVSFGVTAHWSPSERLTSWLWSADQSDGERESIPGRVSYGDRVSDDPYDSKHPVRPLVSRRVGRWRHASASENRSQPKCVHRFS